MDSRFTAEEQKSFRLKKYIKDNIFGLILDFVMPVAVTAIILYICRAERFGFGIVLAAAYSAGKLAYELSVYKKRIDTDIK